MRKKEEEGDRSIGRKDRKRGGRTALEAAFFVTLLPGLLYFVTCRLFLQ